MLQVFKNRKMPGRMGGVQRTVKNVWVYQIDPARNLLYLKGQVISSAFCSTSAEVIML
jgi:large subunit ribosomal protein L3